MSDNENPFSFDKDGDAYKAAQFRDNFTIREFAEFLADCDPTKALNTDSWGNVYDSSEYQEKVEPWVRLLVDLVRERQIQVPDESDEIPF